LLSLAAVPFTFGDNQMGGGNLAARRQLRRSAGTCPPSSGPFDSLDANKRAIIAVIVSEAAKEIQSVMGLGLPRDPDAEPIPAPPPNSPNDQQTTFQFPEARLNRRDGLPVARSLSGDLESSAEEDEKPERPKRTRSFRTRRRVPSFKTGQPPRVPAKVGCCSSEADDEASETDSFESRHARLEQATETETVTERASAQELQLKLNLLSETRASLPGDDVEEWARVGSELRSIADSFQRGLDDVDGDSEGGAVDILALINLMLPVSVPQSLWSALVSYAAWKIFKQFQ
jgi:hypothetical protein